MPTSSRLESIVTDCERIGCLPILIIPPGNDASDPNQSYALPEARAPERHALFERLAEIRSYEDSARLPPSRHTVKSLPRNRCTRKPITAWHGCSRRRVSFAEADRHFTLARDDDGLPMRCCTRLETAYRTVAQRHERTVVLVDGPLALKAISSHGILGNDLFHDNVHPNLRSQVTLASQVLSSLKDRAAFGWPKSTPAPPSCCRASLPTSKSMRPHGLPFVPGGAAQFGQIAFLTVDPADRIVWRARYTEAARSIEAGIAPVDTGIPGVGERLSARAAPA